MLCPWAVLGTSSLVTGINYHNTDFGQYSTIFFCTTCMVPPKYATLKCIYILHESCLWLGVLGLSKAVISCRGARYSWHREQCGCSIVWGGANARHMPIGERKNKNCIPLHNTPRNITLTLPVMHPPSHPQ